MSHLDHVEAKRQLRSARYMQFLEANKAWSAELSRRFGKRAGDVRYTAQGHGNNDKNDPLFALYCAFVDARDAWEASL